ncbi:MAG: hypothetical protein EXS16_07530 [Gemmataceae bacterium]|nr:hypothetical protein [Gemmataceae bacterium]
MQRFSYLLGSLLILLLGCQTGPHLYHVKGTVTHHGNPVPAGVIFFDPDLTKQNDGPQGFAFIKDGVYDTAAKGSQGIIGKAYVVRIRGFDGKQANELPMGQPLFLEFQKAVDFPLQDSTHNFQVSGK